MKTTTYAAIADADAIKTSVATETTRRKGFDPARVSPPFAAIPMLQGERLELAPASAFYVHSHHAAAGEDLRLEIRKILGASTALPITVFHR